MVWVGKILIILCAFLSLFPKTTFLWFQHLIKDKLFNISFLLLNLTSFIYFFIIILSACHKEKSTIYICKFTAFYLTEPSWQTAISTGNRRIWNAPKLQWTQKIVFFMRKCSSHQKLIKSKFKQCTSSGTVVLHGGNEWACWFPPSIKVWYFVLKMDLTFTNWHSVL